MMRIRQSFGTGSLKKAVLVLAVSWLACLLCSRSAHAGQWVIVYHLSGSGQCLYGSPWNYQYTRLSSDSIMFQGTDYTVYDSATATVNDQTATVSVGANADATLYWASSNDLDAPPKSVNVREYAGAFSEGWTEYPAADVRASGSVDNGLGSPVKESLDFSDDSDTAWQTSRTKIASGSHLETLAVDPSRGTIPGSSTAYWGKAQVDLCSQSAGIAADWLGSYSTTDPYAYYERLNADCSVTYGIAFDNRAVTIDAASSLEDSYGIGAYEPQHGSNRYLHLRKNDGSMVVDSAVVKADNLLKTPSNVYLHANTPGFRNPYYKWDLHGDGKPTPYTSQYLGTEAKEYVSLPLQLNFGKDLSSFPKTTTAQVDVRDVNEDGNGADNATATNTYTILWHLPAEFKSTVTSTGPNRMCGAGVDTDGQTAIGPNRTVFFTISPRQADYTVAVSGGEDSGGAEAGSIFLGGAGAVAPALIEGPIGLAGAILLTGASIYTGFQTPPDPQHDTRQADYNEYVADVYHQKAVNDSGQTSNDIPRLNPSTFADTAVGKFQQLQAEWGEAWKDHWQEDTFFNSQNMTAAAQAGYYRDMIVSDGDAYGLHGYTGPAHGVVYTDKAVFYVFTWKPGP